MSIVMTEEQKSKKPTTVAKNGSTMPENNKRKPTTEHPSGTKPQNDDPVEKYQNIQLNFGKYAGKMLRDVSLEDPKYLQWLKQRFEKDENASPTMKAIIKFANAL